MGQLNGADIATLQAGFKCQVFLSDSGLNPKTTDGTSQGLPKLQIHGTP